MFMQPLSKKAIFWWNWMEHNLDQLLTGQKTPHVNNTGKKSVHVFWAPTLKYSTSSWAVITDPLISFSTMFSGASTMGTSTCSCSRKSGSISEKVKENKLTNLCQTQERSFLSHTMQSCSASSLNCLSLAPVDEDHSQPRDSACTSPENGTKVTPKPPKPSFSSHLLLHFTRKWYKCNTPPPASVHNCFTCCISLQRCCHAWSWLSEFNSDVLSSCMLSSLPMFVGGSLIKLEDAFNLLFKAVPFLQYRGSGNLGTNPPCKVQFWNNCTMCAVNSIRVLQSQKDTPTVLCYPSAFATCWLCDYNSCAICDTLMTAETRTNGAKPSQTHLSACRQSGGWWLRADPGAAWGNSWCPQNRNWCDGESAAVLHAACRTPTTWVFSVRVDDCTDPVLL